MPDIDAIMPDLDDEMARTRAVLAAVPQAQMDWRPGTAMRTIGWNANHLAESRVLSPKNVPDPDL